MAQTIPETGKTYDVGLVTFTTAPGKADGFARHLSEEWTYCEPDVYLICGVRWAAAMEDESTVIAAVRADEGQLASWVAGIVMQFARYGVAPAGSEVMRYYKDGRVTVAGRDGGP